MISGKFSKKYEKWTEKKTSRNPELFNIFYEEYFTKEMAEK